MHSPDNAPLLKVIAMVRVSTADQAADHHAGIPRQLAAIAQTVKFHRLELVKTIQLVLSGTKVRTHPEFIWMRQQLESRQVSGVVVADMDRLMRPEGYEDFELLDAFKEAGVMIYAGGAVHDMSEEMQGFSVMTRLFFAGMERRHILKRADEARQILKKKGAHVGGKHQLPLGIDYDRKTQIYSLNPEIVKIQEGFRLIDEGLTNIREVGRKLGIAERTLHRQLRNKLYAGLKVYEQTRAKHTVLSKRGKEYHPKLPVAAEKRVEVRVMDNPAIPLDRWERVQAILKAKGRSWINRRDDSDSGNILVGIAFCDCGARLYLSPNSRNPGKGYYYCSKNHYKTRTKGGGCGKEYQRQVDLTAITLSFARDFLTKPEAVETILRHCVATKLSTSLEPSPEAHGLPETSDWEGRRRRLKRLFEMGHIDEAELTRRLDQLTTEKVTFDIRAAAKEDALVASISNKIVDTTTAAIVRGARAFRRITDPRWQQKALSGLFQEIQFESHQIKAFKMRADIFPADDCENGTQSGWDSSPRRA